MSPGSPFRPGKPGLPLAPGAPGNPGPEGPPPRQAQSPGSPEGWRKRGQQRRQRVENQKGGMRKEEIGGEYKEKILMEI